MNQFEKYTAFITIVIEHDYFNGLLPVDLCIADSLIEKKYGIQLRRNQNSWILYGREFLKEDFYEEFQTMNFKFNPIVEKPSERRERDKKNLVGDEQTSLNFIIKPLSDLFYHVTSSMKENVSDFHKDIYDKEGILVKSGNVTLHFLTLSKYFEYIFFTRSNQINFNIVEANKQIDFQRVFNDEKWNDEQHKIQFISKHQIALSSQYDYQINLIEETKYGERIILNAIKIPDPSSISKQQPKNAITAYYTV